jgi:hypothetical protein
MRHFLIFVFALLTLSSNLCWADVNFTKHLIDGTFLNVSSVSAADINGDSLVDILGTAWDLNTVAWWSNNGEGGISATRRVIDSAFAGASFAVAVDLDLDGFTDVVGTARNGNEVAWWKSNGGDPIQWTKQTVDGNFGGAHEVHPVDLDGDGDVDLLAAASTRNEIAWWENLGGTPPTWNKHVIDSNFAGARSVVAVDIDNDGDLDILGAAFTADDITLWRNNGDLTWDRQTIAGSFDGAHMVRFGDIDGDGDMDVVGAAYNAGEVAWWANEGGDPISWTEHPIRTNFPGALAIYIADVDGDGDLDVIGSAETANDVRVWYNNGGQPVVWSEQIVDGNFGGAWPVFAADIDGDGYIDLLAGASSAGDVAWWEQRASAHVDRLPVVPIEPKLVECYPNPFNASTMITYDLPKSRQVSLRVFDLLGRGVAVLEHGMMEAGSHRVMFDGSGLCSGIYFARLEAGKFSQTKKLMLLK